MKEVLGRMKNSKEKNMCWQDGRLFDDKEDWVVDSCTKCTCQVSSGHVKICADLSLMSVILTLVFINGRSPRSCATKSHVPPWPVPAPRSSTASAVPCACVSNSGCIHSVTPFEMCHESRIPVGSGLKPRDFASSVSDVR